jgi:hypothetical protein
MDDYKEMGLIYEAFAKGRNPYNGTAKLTNTSYPPGQSDNPSHSYRKPVPLSDPGGSGRNYDAALTSGQGHVCDEEASIAPKEITNVDVIDKIESLIRDAQSFEDTKTIIALDELKRYIVREL